MVARSPFDKLLTLLPVLGICLLSVGMAAGQDAATPLLKPATF